MLDSDLAEVYGVVTGQLNRAVRRNRARFPKRFAFQLTKNEWDALKCQIGISNAGRGGSRHAPWVFTEHGASMLAGALNSDRAIQASIAIIDAFVHLRHVLHTNRDLAQKIAELSEKIDIHDESISVIFHQLDELVNSGIPVRPKERIGYTLPKEPKEPKDPPKEAKEPPKEP